MNLNEMTTEQLHQAARNYRRNMLEGGEGYNPYTAEIRCREVAAPRTESDSDKLASLRNQLNRLDNSLARECGTYDEAKCDAIRAQIAEIEDRMAAEAAAKEEAEWTLEVTVARRAAWNEWARSHKSGRITAIEIARKQRDQGWAVDALKRAIARHNL